MWSMIFHIQFHVDVNVVKVVMCAACPLSGSRIGMLLFGVCGYRYDRLQIWYICIQQSWIVMYSKFAW